MSNTLISPSELDTNRLVAILEQAHYTPQMHAQFGLFVRLHGMMIFLELTDLPGLKLTCLFTFKDGASTEQKQAFVNRANQKLIMNRFFAHDARNLLIVDFCLPISGGTTPPQIVSALSTFAQVCMDAGSLDHESILT